MLPLKYLSQISGSAHKGSKAFKHSPATARISIFPLSNNSMRGSEHLRKKPNTLQIGNTHLPPLNGAASKNAICKGKPDKILTFSL